MPGHHYSNDAPAGTGCAEDGFLAGHPLSSGSTGSMETQFTADVTDLMQRLRSAEREISELKEALASQRLIGVAVGLLAHRFKCSSEQAWRLLVRLSQTTNVKVREIARILSDAHAGGDVTADAHVLAMLAAQLPDEIHDLRNPTPER